MSSFRNKKRKDPFFMKCYHCGINTRIHKCHNCGLWNSNFNKNLIPKSDKIIRIKNVFIINLIDDKIRLNIFNETLSKSNIKTNNRKWQVYPAINGRDSKLIEKNIKDFTEEQKKIINYHLKK